MNLYPSVFLDIAFFHGVFLLLAGRLLWCVLGDDFPVYGGTARVF